MPDFVPTKLEEEREQEKGKTIGVWFNDSELEELGQYGVFLHQQKTSTIVKQMVYLGAKLIDDHKISAVRDLVFNNVRKNKRLGIAEIDPKIRKS
jgi:hypothetical protein